MNRTYLLYLFGIIAVVLSMALSSLGWLPLLAFLVILPLGAIWIWRSQGGALGDLGFRFSSGWLRYLLIGLIAGLVIPLLFQVVQVLFDWSTLTSRGEPLGDVLPSLLTGLVRLALVVAIEEFVFRGFFNNALSRKVSVWIALVLSSLLWGATHLGSMVNEGLTPGLMIIGMVSFLAWGITLSLSYFLAGNSLWLPYGLHLGVNFGFSLLGAFFIAEQTAPEWLVGHPSWTPESGLIGVVVWTILALIFYWLTGRDRAANFTMS